MHECKRPVARIDRIAGVRLAFPWFARDLQNWRGVIHFAPGPFGRDTAPGNAKERGQRTRHFDRVGMNEAMDTHCQVDPLLDGSPLFTRRPAGPGRRLRTFGAEIMK